MFTFPIAHFGGGLQYTIDQSLRFAKGDSPQLTGGTGQTGSATTFTIAMWIKRAEIAGNNLTIWSAGDGSNKRAMARFVSGGGSSVAEDINFSVRTGGAFYELNANVSNRDPAAWTHYQWVWDTTNSTAADRMRLYVGGERITSFTNTLSNPGSSLASDSWNVSSFAHQIGFENSARHLDGYIAEAYHIDGSALEPSSFTETHNNGYLIPKKYTGSFGTRGWYLKFEDSSDLGNDSSGNNNNFTSSGLTAADQVTDTPTNNFCVLSPIDSFGSGLTLSDGNLRAVPAASAYGNNHGTFYIDSGKWVFECKHTSVFGEACGWSPEQELTSGSSDRGYFMFADGRAYDNVTNTGTKGTSLANGDFRYVFYDADAQAMWFAHVDVSSSNALVYDNSATKAEIEAGTTTNAVFTNIPAGFWAPGIWMDTSGVIEVNFGQSAFATTSDLPSGFNTLSAANLSDPSIPDPSVYFQTTLYTGNGSTQSINQSGNSTFEPSWVWIKARGQAYDHALYDAVRGATKELKSNANDAESTITNGLTAFESDGFALGDRLGVNQSGENFVAWQWKAAGTGSSNGNGSISATVSADATAGFSVGTYTGNGTDNATVGHGLSGADMVWVKRLNTTGNWRVYEKSTNKNLFLDLTNAGASPTEIKSTSSTTFTLGSGNGFNGSGDSHVFYAFKSIPGFSKIGSYQGNSSSDGPFVFTGFKVQWLLVKCTNASSTRWLMHDTTRNTPQGKNVTDTQFFAELNSAESQDSTYDFLSNGFKPRRSDGNHNLSGREYLFLALAETPFKTATAR